MQGLGKKPLSLSDEQIDDFACIMAAPDRGGLTVDDICKRFGISSKTVYLYTHRPEVIKIIKSKRAEVIRLELGAIDKAMIKKASAGDVKAAELIYERWDGFVHASKTQIDGTLDTPESADVKRKERVNDFLATISGKTVPVDSEVKSDIVSEPATSPEIKHD